MKNFEHKVLCMMCVCVLFPFILDIKFVNIPAGVTQEDHTGFLIHLPSAVRALTFLARRIQPFLSLVDREAEFCVPTNDFIVLHLLGLYIYIYIYIYICTGIYILIYSEEKSQLPGFELTSPRVRRLRGYQLSYRGDRY